MKKCFPYKWELVFWLFIAFFFNQADRQIFNVLLLDIQNDLGLTADRMGLVGTALLLVNGLLLPVAGILGDRVSKKWIIVGALLLWSVSTMLTGLSTGLPALILLRSVATGGGEAFYSPSANKLISENHSGDTRATAISVHQMALYLGFIVSGIIATMVAKSLGWRSAFFIFGGGGIVLAALMAWRLRPDTVERRGESLGQLVSGGLRAFIKSPTALLLTLALAGFNFSGQAFLIWMPTCLQENFGLDSTRAAFDASFYMQAAAAVGILLGARLSDRYAGKYPAARIWALVAGLVLGAPFFYMIGKASSEVGVCAAMAGYGLFKGVYDSNLVASLYEVIAPRFRAMATSFYFMFSFLISCFSPWLLGILKPAIGLNGGMSLMGVVYMASAIPLVIAIRYTLKKDRYTEATC